MREATSAKIEDQLSRLVERLRSAPESKLTRADERLDGRSLADACFEFVCWCAAENVAKSVPVENRMPHRLHPLASGDQVQVLGCELVAIWESLGSDSRREFSDRLTALAQLA